MLPTQRQADVLSLRIAARFLKTSPAQSVLIMAGIAVGIATQVFVGSLITSLQADLVDTTVGSSPHVTITAAEEGDPVAYTSEIRSLVDGDERVEPGAIAPVRLASALFSDGDTTAPLSITAGELSDLDVIYALTDRTIEGSTALGDYDIVLGVDFAEKYSLAPGDTVELVFAGNRVEELTLAAAVDLGSAAANERTAFIGPELPRDIFEWEADEYSAIQTQMLDPFDSAVVAEEWDAELTELSVSEWQSANADLLTALQSQSASSYMIQVFILVAVALGIASTLAISAVQKTRQIGILKAMGLSDKRSGRIFLWQASMLGVGGTVGGLALGFALIWSFSFIPVPFSIRPEPGFILLSSAVGITVALLSSIIPIRKTSRLDPIEVIQSG